MPLIIWPTPNERFEDTLKLAKEELLSNRPEICSCPSSLCVCQGGEQCACICSIGSMCYLCP